MRNKFITVSVFCLFTILILPSCSSSAGKSTDAGTTTFGCSDENKCSGENSICIEGRCEIGVCAPATAQVCTDEVTENCCKKWEFCNYDFLCAPDPKAPVGSECETSVDCPMLGQFCSGGNCYESAGRVSCTSSYICEDGERCDRNVFLCVEDIGGCSFCGDSFPELCCETDFTCDADTDRCIDTTVEAECTVDDTSKCLPSELCDPFGQCVQCYMEEHCSGDLKCDVSSGTCYSERDDCSMDGICPGDKLCAPESQVCVVPECEVDSRCRNLYDTRWVCNTQTYKCDLPDPVCDSALDSLEPNNSIGEATELVDNSLEESILCRQDNDVYKFPISANQRIAVRVEFPEGNAAGTRIEILDENGRQVSQTTVPSIRDVALLVFITAENLTATHYYVRLNGNGIFLDSWKYSLNITSSEAPEITTCEDEMNMGIEPNDTLETAYLIEAGTKQYARCNSGDVDYYKIEVPVQNGLEVILDSVPDDGELRIDLLSSDGTLLSSNDESGPSKIVEAREGFFEFYIRVYLKTSNLPNIDGQQYTMTTNLIARPDVCINGDVDEPLNDELETGPVLELDAPATELLCVKEDVDFHKIIIPPSTGVKIDLTFNHSHGNLRLDLYDEDGTLVLESNRSKRSSGAESIEVPFLMEEKSYHVKVSLASGSLMDGLEYVLNAASYDATICFVSEAVPNNDFFNGQCLAGITTDVACVGQTLSNPIVQPSAETCLAAPETAGCASVCGLNDHDWYRIGKINNNQSLKVAMSYDAAAENGQLELRLLRANYDNSSWATVQSIADVNSTGLLELTYSASSLEGPFIREYAVAVLPYGTTGFAALPYSIGIEIGAECMDDVEEPNQNPAESTFMFSVRNQGEVASETLNQTMCGKDTDVYEMFIFPGETLSVTFAGPEGSEMYLGGRPRPITDAAILLDGGMGMTLENCPLTVMNGPQDTVCTQASYTAVATTDVFVTVKQTDVMNLSGVGSYQVKMEIAP